MTSEFNKNAKVTNALEDKLFSGYNDISKLFKTMKENTCIDTNVMVNANDMLELNRDDFIDVISYYRRLKGISQCEFSQMLGLNEDSYGQYERGIIKLTNIEMIEKMVKTLDIEDNIELPDYISFLKENPKEQIKDYMLRNNLGYKQFAQKSQIPEGTIRGWFDRKEYLKKKL